MAHSFVLLELSCLQIALEYSSRQSASGRACEMDIQPIKAEQDCEMALEMIRNLHDGLGIPLKSLVANPKESLAS